MWCTPTHTQSKHNEFGPFIHTWHWYARAHVFSLVLKHDFVFLCFGFFLLAWGMHSRLSVLQLHCFCSLLLVLPCMRLWFLSDTFIMDWTIVQWWFYAPLPFRMLLLWISFQQDCMCWTFCVKETNYQRKRVSASHEHSKDVTQTQQRCHTNITKVSHKHTKDAIRTQQLKPEPRVRYVYVCMCASCTYLCLNLCWCLHYVLVFVKLLTTFSILMYILRVMFVQRFEP